MSSKLCQSKIQGFETRESLSLRFPGNTLETPLVTPLSHARGEPQYLKTFRAGADPGSELSHLGLGSPRDRDQETATWGGCDLGNSGVWDRDYGWGVRVRRHLAHAGGVLYGMELGSVTLKINTQHTLGRFITHFRAVWRGVLSVYGIALLHAPPAWKLHVSENRLHAC